MIDQETLIQLGWSEELIASTLANLTSLREIAAKIPEVCESKNKEILVGDFLASGSLDTDGPAAGNACYSTLQGKRLS